MDTLTSVEPTEKRVFGINQHSLAYMSSLIKGHDIDIQMLTQSPITEASKLSHDLVEIMNSVKFNELLNKQKWFHKFTGADLEARLKFEIAVKNVTSSIVTLSNIGLKISHMQNKLLYLRDHIKKTQPKISQVINLAKKILEHNTDSDELLKERFERMLGNIMAFEASNVVTLETSRLALINLQAWKDRIHEVTTVLFPIWQRNAMTMVQMDHNNKEKASLIEVYVNAREKLIGKLIQ